MRAPSLGSTTLQGTVGAVDMMEMSRRFSDVKLAPIQETEGSTPVESPRKEPGKDWKKGAFRAPRRAFSSTDYETLGTASGHSSGTSSPALRTAESDGYFSLQPAPFNPFSSIPSTPTDLQHALPRVSLPPTPYGAVPHPRPALPSPQRSYSVMDYVPVPILQRPGEKLKLIHVPAELHFVIFDFLDPIDSTCLGLANKHFYAIHRRMHGTVALSARRSGPNDLEWAWRNGLITSADLRSKLKKQEITGGSAPSPVVQPPRGQVYCIKCGISRCELHKHIQEWMGEGYEYCEVRQKFGPVAPTAARKSCYRSSPRHPHRCGRHVRQQRAVRLV